MNDECGTMNGNEDKRETQGMMDERNSSSLIQHSALFRVSTLRFCVQLLFFVLFVYAGLWGMRQLRIGRHEPSFPTLSCEFVQNKVIKCYLLDLQRSLMNGASNWYMGLIEPTVFFLAFCLLLGRAWCGWICPLGFLQDCIGWIRAALGLGYLRSGPRAKRVYAVTAYSLLGMTVFLSFFLGRPESRLYAGPNTSRSDNSSRTGTRIRNCQFCRPGETSHGHPDGGCCAVCRIIPPSVPAPLGEIGRGGTQWQVGLAVPYCQICPALQLLPLAQGDTKSFLLFDHSTASGWVMSILAVTTLASFLLLTPVMRRFWCRLCAMGILMRFLRVNRWAMFELVKEPHRCTYCGSCERACPMDITEIFEERVKPSVRVADCHLCLKCVEACAEDHVLEAHLLGRRVMCSKFEYACGKVKKNFGF
jgi:ferredoxin